METFYYAKSDLFGKMVYLLASSKGLMYLSTEVNEDEQFFKHIAYKYNIVKTQCQYSDEHMGAYLALLSSYQAGDEPDTAKLKLDLRGTSFQVSVWQALLTIPYGATTYYGAIAEAIDNVKAVRAVGGAIGANPILIFVPCHRVIGKSGALTGFSSGIALKEVLLEHEVQHTIR